MDTFSFSDIYIHKGATTLNEQQKKQPQRVVDDSKRPYTETRSYFAMWP